MTKVVEECRDDTCRPTVGIYALTSCYGCQLKLATIEKILDVERALDIKSFYMVTSDSSMDEKVDIAIVEGSVSTEKDLEELKEIRENSNILVAIGACAVNGGVQSWAEDEMDIDRLHKTVYGDGEIDMKPIQADPIHYHVKVDHYIHGCPPEEDEIVHFIATFLFGTYPTRRDYPVCAECRLVGNSCILIERGAPCLGPITTAGCKARCITYDVPCIGCRGPVPFETAWFDSLALTFKEKGFDEEYIRARMKIFGAHDANLEKLLKRVYGDDE